jgi:hypothetical protein
VCLLPGTEIAFDLEVECNRGAGLLPKRKIQGKVARFRHSDRIYAHRDALEFGRDAHDVMRRSARDRAAVAGFARPEQDGRADTRSHERRAGAVGLVCALTVAKLSTGASGPSRVDGLMNDSHCGVARFKEPRDAELDAIVTR